MIVYHRADRTGDADAVERTLVLLGWLQCRSAAQSAILLGVLVAVAAITQKMDWNTVLAAAFQHLDRTAFDPTDSDQDATLRATIKSEAVAIVEGAKIAMNFDESAPPKALN